MQQGGSLPLADGRQVDVVRQLLPVERLLVGLHDVGEVVVGADLGEHCLLLRLLEVVLRPVVLVLRKHLLLH